ncbi:hypothetical protein AB3G33_05685 [Flavobacterium sp. WC2421]|jgi:hypothetical protein|uniref:Uncharacterized protein n=2 Tax=unclassified Flavobacterium TaxID=196869 RepID=A0AB39W2A9_9FLAO
MQHKNLTPGIGMNKTDLFIGFLLGLLASLLGCYLFIVFATQYNFISGVQIMKSQGSLGKLVTLGSILDLILFAILLKSNKEVMARGVVLSVIILTIITVFL